MTAASSAASGTRLTDDGLIQYGREHNSRELSRGDTTGLLAVLFAVVAIGALALPPQRSLSLEAAGICLLCYALASRVRFEFAGGFAIPTQCVLVAMWFLVPARMLPLLVCAGLVLSWLPDLRWEKMSPDRLALVIVSSWNAVGAALILFFWGSHAPSWHSIPILAAALGAQFAFDYASAYLCTRPVLRVTPFGQLKAMAPTFAVDLMLAPLGLLVAFSAYHHPWALLLVLPVLALFATFARERQHRIDNALELSTAYRGTAMLLGDVIEADDAYTGSHSRDVVDLVISTADKLGLEPRDRRCAEFAALLHDVGKVKIPSEIINKAGPLDDAEWEVMKTHTIVGEELLERIGGLLGEVGRIVRSCHERWDGTGYPDRLAGEQIPLAARIVCACDAWSAMTTDRSYRKARPHEDAAAELRASAGTHFDPHVVDALTDVLSV